VAAARAETLGAEAGDFATHVSIKALHYLIALAECLNFSRAANRSAVTQPTLSIQVRKLEEYLGVKLFERNHTRVVLTDDGKKVLRLALIVVDATITRNQHSLRPASQPLSLKKSISAGKPNR
jgi:LysR family hydrogen peroxide-inducible transcriptional activator